jgi:hypothetical protein
MRIGKFMGWEWGDFLYPMPCIFAEETGGLYSGPEPVFVLPSQIVKNELPRRGAYGAVELLRMP